MGCAAVGIDDFEAAGHPGGDGIGSLVLLPRVVDGLDVPIHGNLWQKLVEASELDTQLIFRGFINGEAYAGRATHVI